MIDKSYSDIVKQRAQDSHVYQEHQATGLEIAQLLDDKKHIALYMKLCREHAGQELIRLAKTVCEKKDVQNKGAYFMKILKEKGYFPQGALPPKKSKS